MNHDDITDDKTGDFLKKGAKLVFDQCNARRRMEGVSRRHITWKEIFWLREIGSIYA